MVTKEAPAKRKKTADMPDSPPKRITRARAKAPDADKAKSKVTQVTTPSAKALAEKKNASAPKTNKRKSRADDEAGVGVQDHEPEVPVVEQPMKEAEAKPTRQKKAPRQRADGTDRKTADAPKPKSRQTKAVAVEKPTTEAPKTRGRPKRTAVEQPTEQVEGEQGKFVEPEPIKKTTRGRSAATKLKSLPAQSKVSITKKKVQFQEGSDKENIPIETQAPKKSAMKSAGLKAKPVRKPAVPRASTRGRKAMKEALDNGEEHKKAEALPLSPKKANQVAKAPSTSSEDELSGAKTPVRALSKSPTKGPSTISQNLDSVSRLNFGQSDVPSSPSKEVVSTVLASPARRPPQSSFKDSLKSPPKKIDLGNSATQRLFLSLNAPTPMKTSLLQESPRKGKLGDSTLHPMLPPSQTYLQSSLLQSPARRPAASPFKPMVPTSPSKPSAGIAPKPQTSQKFLHLSPQRVISSPLRAARSPEQTIKVHIIVDEEKSTQKPRGNVSRPASPPKTSVKGRAPPNTSEGNLCVSPGYEPSTKAAMAKGVDMSEPHPVSASVFSLASSALRRVSMESQSEDELASPEKVFAPIPFKTQGVATKDFGTPAVIARSDTEQTSKDQVLFTPLVDQLSSWTTSSPCKQSEAHHSRKVRGVFSLGGIGMLVDSEPNISNVGIESPAKPSFFEDEMAVTEGQDPSMVVTNVDADDLFNLKTSLDSLASEDYGDENAMPSEGVFIRAEQENESQDQTLTCTPAKVFTPAKRAEQLPREIHTVSKVPLRPSAEDSPLKVPRQRSQSLGGPLTTVQQPPATASDGTKEKRPSDGGGGDMAGFPAQPATPVLAATALPWTPSSGMRLDAETPGRTQRKGVVPDVLKGAVVYVDVHTTEGADASGIFIDLLTQMGARCVKQWNWNPRASLGASLESTASPSIDAGEDLPQASKIGITHVVYKDGGKRTLEKVRSSNGIVLCVGVGWVLE